MSQTHLLIGIIAGTKATDALLCQSLESAGFRLKIVHYKIPFHAWIPWIWKRIRERGHAAFIGNLFLGIWLRIERGIERAMGTSLWTSELSEPPSWRVVRSERKWLFNEEALITAFKDVEAILLLDSFRLSHRFFRSLKKPSFQILWGDVPNYLGDSGGYWAYMHEDPVSLSFVACRGQFDALMPIKRISVATGENETLRTIKIKQAVVMSSALPKILTEALERSFKFNDPRKIVGRFFYAPTLWTYLRLSRSRSSFPRYAFRVRPCMLYASEKNV